MAPLEKGKETMEEISEGIATMVSHSLEDLVDMAIQYAQDREQERKQDKDEFPIMDDFVKGMKHDIPISHDSKDIQGISEDSSDRKVRESTIKLLFEDINVREEMTIRVLQTAKVEAIYSFRFKKWCY